MRSFLAAALLLASAGGSAESKPAPVTVPVAIDHNRIVIDAEVPLPGGATRRVHAWVDNGNPELEMSRRLATMLGLPVTCSDRECSAPAPTELRIGGMSISLAGSKLAHIPLKPVAFAAALYPGMDAEINLPSTVLRHYDVLVDFPGHKLTIGAPGTVQFRGPSAKVQINGDTGLIQIPSQIENKKYNFALDLGSSISFLSPELFYTLATAHLDWPYVTGAVGPANMWGADEEKTWKVMRVDRVQYGPLFLTNVPFVDVPKARWDYFEKRAAMPTAGLLASQALLNYRVGLDYAHSMAYFEIGRFFTFPDFDVVGLILRPEDDGRFTVLGITDLDGARSVPSGANGVQAGDHLVAVDGIAVRGATMGQVWLMLGGTPGQERKLTIEHAGKEFVVSAKVQHFLAEKPDDDKKKNNRY